MVNYKIVFKNSASRIWGLKKPLGVRPLPFHCYMSFTKLFKQCSHKILIKNSLAWSNGTPKKVKLEGACPMDYKGSGRGGTNKPKKYLRNT